jgi:NADH-quinone oxidoreductase subunit G
MSEVTRTSVSITIDGRKIEAEPGELLIAAAERAGTYVPRFCYHPRMEPVGVCRMCLVEVDGPRGATLQPACYLQVNDGMNVITDSPKVKKAQDGVLEFLLANHPLDCPVCDKGGECPLQDQTLAHGSGETRFIEEKRHFPKPISIGENVLLDRERCIQCSRCTRFASEVAGDTQIAFSGRGDLIEVAPDPAHPFDSVFSGNTVQICPVGALTAKPYRFTARPWDLDQVESTCSTCAVGCQVAVQSSSNRLTRVLGLDSEAINHGWMCDKGRFAIEAVDANPDSVDVLSPKTRITEPLVRVDGKLQPTTWNEALAKAAAVLSVSSSEQVGIIGGAALTNEGAFAWERFGRGVLGTDNLDAQYGDGLDGLLLQSLPAATIEEATKARVVVTLTGDLREELPILFLRLRETVVHRGQKLIEFTSVATGLTEHAAVSIPVQPGEIASRVAALTEKKKSGADPIDTARELIGNGEEVVFIVGRSNVAEDASFVESAIQTLRASYPKAKFLSALRRSNVHGALDMGLAPNLRPGRSFQASEGRNAVEQINALASGKQKAVLLAGGCLIGNVVDQKTAKAALKKANVVAVTGHGGATLEFADVVLPALVANERTGTVTNIEGRVLSVQAKVVAAGTAWNDVAIASELAEQFGQSLGLSSVEQTAQTIESTTGYPAWSVLSAQSVEGLLVNSSNEGPAIRPLDPIAFPGVQPASSIGLGAPTGSLASTTVETVSTVERADEGDLDKVKAAKSAAPKAKEIRLVVARALYDDGMAVQASAAFDNLRALAIATFNPDTAKKAGLSAGDRVKVSSKSGKATFEVREDVNAVPGTCTVLLGARDAKGADQVRMLVEFEEPVTRVEVVKA